MGGAVWTVSVKVVLFWKQFDFRGHSPTAEIRREGENRFLFGNYSNPAGVTGLEWGETTRSSHRLGSRSVEIKIVDCYIYANRWTRESICGLALAFKKFVNLRATFARPCCDFVSQVVRVSEVFFFRCRFALFFFHRGFCLVGSSFRRRSLIWVPLLVVSSSSWNLVLNTKLDELEPLSRHIAPRGITKKKILTVGHRSHKRLLTANL